MGPVFAFSPDQHDHTFIEPTQAFQALLAIVLALILLGLDRRVEHWRASRQVDAMLA